MGFPIVTFDVRFARIMDHFPKNWNRCDVCGRFIAIDDFGRHGPAIRRLLTPDAEGATETYETLCNEHSEDAWNTMIIEEATA